MGSPGTRTKRGKDRKGGETEKMSGRHKGGDLQQQPQPQPQPQPHSRPIPHPVLVQPHQESISIDEIFAQNSRKIQVLREDHQEMLGTYAVVKEDLSRAHIQLRQFLDTAQKVRGECDFEVKKVYDRSLAVESQFRGIEAVKFEHDQVVAHLRNLSEAKIQLAAEFRGVDSELNRVKFDANDVADIKNDLDAMRLELMKGRAAVEFEKKTRAANLEQYKAMESNIISMKNDIERLRAEKRARAAEAAASNPDHGYLANYGGPDMAFQGGRSAHYPTHQAAGPPDSASPHLYRPPTGDPGLFYMRQTNVPKG